MNKRGLLLIKLAILMVNMLIATLVLTSVIPVVTGGISVELPESNNLNWEMYGHNLTLNTSVKIINHGYYSIDNLTITIHLSTEDSFTILNKVIEIPHVRGGTEVQQPINIVIDIEDLLARGGTDLIFTDTTIYMKVDVLAYYTLRTIKFTAEYTDQYPWEAIIKEVTVDFSNATYESGESGLVVSIPYVIDTSTLLRGKTANIEVRIRNSTNELARDYETINLGERVRGDLVFIISDRETTDLIIHSQSLIVESYLYFSGETFEEEFSYYWGAPLSNLDIKDPTVVGDVITFGYSFRNEMNGELSLSVRMEVFDANDNQIGYSTDAFQVASGEYVERNISVLVSGTPSYSRITLEDINTGLKYSITRGVV